MTAANVLIQKAILPEIIGCWFTKPRQDSMDNAPSCTDNCEEISSASSTANTSGTGNNEDPPCAGNTQNTGSDNECATYCYCSGRDDGTKMTGADPDFKKGGCLNEKGCTVTKPLSQLPCSHGGGYPFLHKTQKPEQLGYSVTQEIL